MTLQVLLNNMLGEVLGPGRTESIWLAYP